MKTRFLIVCALIITTVLFAVGNTPSGQVKAQETINLSITCTCSEATVEWLNTYVIPQFQEHMATQNRTVNVELLDFEFTDEEYREQVALDFSLEQGADVLAFDGFWVPEFVESGLLKPLNEIAGETVDEWEGWEHIPSGVQQIISYQGERYGIPGGTDVRVMFYRTDLFDAAGIETPWQPTNWQDIIDTAQRLKEAGIQIPIQINAGTQMGEATTMQGYFMLLLGAGHHMYDFEEQKWIVSSPAMLQVLEMYQELYSSELASLELQMIDGARDESFQGFRDGNIAIYVEGDWFWRSPLRPEDNFAARDEVVQWAAMPAIEPGAGYLGQDFVSISGGTGWILNPSTPYPQEAWELLSFIASKGSTDAFHLLEPRISFRDDVELGSEFLEEMADVMLPLTTVRPLLPEYPLVSYEAQLMTERVISGEMSAEEALQAYDEAVTAIVGEENVIRIPLDE